MVIMLWAFFSRWTIGICVVRGGPWHRDNRIKPMLTDCWICQNRYVEYTLHLDWFPEPPLVVIGSLAFTRHGESKRVPWARNIARINSHLLPGRRRKSASSLFVFTGVYIYVYMYDRP